MDQFYCVIKQSENKGNSLFSPETRATVRIGESWLTCSREKSISGEDLYGAILFNKLYSTRTHLKTFNIRQFKSASCQVLSLSPSLLTSLITFVLFWRRYLVNVMGDIIPPPPLPQHLRRKNHKGTIHQDDDCMVNLFINWDFASAEKSPHNAPFSNRLWNSLQVGDILEKASIQQTIGEIQLLKFTSAFQSSLLKSAQWGW